MASSVVVSALSVTPFHFTGCFLVESKKKGKKQKQLLVGDQAPEIGSDHATCTSFAKAKLRGETLSFFNGQSHVMNHFALARVEGQDEELLYFTELKTARDDSLPPCVYCLPSRTFFLPRVLETPPLSETLQLVMNVCY